jgi:hypothetical protein
MLGGLYALLGLEAGVLLNALIDRLTSPQDRHPFSRCLACGAQPVGWDWVPIVGYALRRGRCPTCGAPWSARAPLLEMATAIIFALLWSVLGPSVLLVLYTLYFCMLEIIFVIDLERHLILNRFIWPAIAFALLTIPLRAWAEGRIVRSGIAAAPVVGLGNVASPGANVAYLASRDGRRGCQAGAVCGIDRGRSWYRVGYRRIFPARRGGRCRASLVPPRRDEIRDPLWTFHGTGHDGRALVWGRPAEVVPRYVTPLRRPKGELWHRGRDSCTTAQS